MNWQRYFQATQYARPRLAQGNRAMGLVESNASGEWLLNQWNLTNGALVPIGPAAAMPFYEISPDGQWVFFLQDEQGNSSGHFVCRAVGGGKAIDLTPDLPSYNSYAMIISGNGQRAGFTRSSPAGFYACVMELDANGQPGIRREIYHTRSLITCPWLSADGKLAVLASSEFNAEMAFGLVALDVDRGEVVATLWDGPGNDLHPMIWSPFSPIPGDPRILTRANRSGLRRPVIWNPLTGERVDLLFEDQTGDVLPKGWSPDGRQILLERLDQAVHGLGVYDVESGTARWLDLPAGVYQDAQFGQEGKIVAQWEDLSHPPQIVDIHPAAGKVVPLLMGDQAEEAGFEWQSITFPSSDGQRVQAWLALPGGAVGEANPGPFPTIIEAHGGPETVQRNGYHPEALAWLEQGFAFASVNYRGSTTFGKAFQDQIKGDWGHWELEDLAACRSYLIQEGIAMPEQVFLTGFSYGGYLTLMALGKQPALWRGGMAGGCMADWRVLYEDATESARQMTLAFFGGSPEECPDRYRDCSPVTYVEQVRAPVFIWMGEQDAHVSSRQMEQYIAQLRASGKRVEAVWYTGGHGGPQDGVNQMVDTQARQMAFAQSVREYFRSN